MLDRRPRLLHSCTWSTTEHHRQHGPDSRKVCVDDLFMDGAWRSAHSGKTRDIHCPADGTLVATVSEAGSTDARAALSSARRAFEAGVWSRLPEKDRAGCCDATSRNRLDQRLPPLRAQAEWGGFKRSGIGRELGVAVLDEYREAKHI